MKLVENEIVERRRRELRLVPGKAGGTAQHRIAGRKSRLERQEPRPRIAFEIR